MSEVKIGEAFALIRVKEDIACLAIGHTLALSMVCLPAVHAIFLPFTVEWEMELCCGCLVGYRRPITALRRRLIHSNVGQLSDEVGLEISAAKFSR